MGATTYAGVELVVRDAGENHRDGLFAERGQPHQAFQEVANGLGRWAVVRNAAADQDARPIVDRGARVVNLNHTPVAHLPPKRKKRKKKKERRKKKEERRKKKEERRKKKEKEEEEVEEKAEQEEQEEEEEEFQNA